MNCHFASPSDVLATSTKLEKTLHDKLERECELESTRRYKANAIV